MKKKAESVIKRHEAKSSAWQQAAIASARSVNRWYEHYEIKPRRNNGMWQ